MSTIAERVRAIVEPLLSARSLELYDLEYAGGSLRILVDRPGGVTLDAVSDATRAISHALDDADPIPAHYTLEVSSPGLERPLRTPAHFASAVGTEVSVKTLPSAEGERRLRGRLLAADDDGIDLGLDDGSERELRYDAIERARTVFEWGPEPKKTVSPKPSKKKANTR